GGVEQRKVVGPCGAEAGEERHASDADSAQAHAVHQLLTPTRHSSVPRPLYILPAPRACDAAAAVPAAASRCGEQRPPRREITVGGGAALRTAAAAPARADAVLTEDGFYREPWFIESFLEIGDDLDQAAKRGKRFAVMWELRGCPYCRETHLVNFARPDIA